MTTNNDEVKKLIRLSQEQADRLNRVCERTNLSQAAFYRMILSGDLRTLDYLYETLKAIDTELPFTRPSRLIQKGKRESIKD